MRGEATASSITCTTPFLAALISHTSVPTQALSLSHPSLTSRLHPKLLRLFLSPSHSLADNTFHHAHSPHQWYHISPLTSTLTLLFHLLIHSLYYSLTHSLTPRNTPAFLPHSVGNSTRHSFPPLPPPPLALTHLPFPILTTQFNTLLIFLSLSLTQPDNLPASPRSLLTS